jgi:2-aminoethylphosphonate-pyruvate transaminase
VRETAIGRILANPRRSLYLSLAGYWEAQERGSTPFTPAVQIAYALDEALAELLEEGVAARIARYAAAAALLREGFTRLGLQCIVPAERRSNTITSLRIPPGHTYATLHDGLKKRGFVIYEGQGKLRDEVFRIANMGHLGPPDFQRCLAALGEVLRA